MECAVLREEDKMDVLYGEADAATIRRFDDHLAGCAACREEMEAFRRLRRDLQEWRTPAPRSSPRGRGSGSRWLAAAAVLIAALGAALGLSGSELRYGEGRLAFRLGRADRQLEERLAQLEAGHRAEIQALRASLARPAAGPQPEAEAEGLLRRVEEMIRASEERQASVLGTSLRELGERSEAQRRYDLARVAAGLSYLDGRTGQHVARTAELVGFVLEASQREAKR